MKNSWVKRLRRAQHDRRIQVGMWARYQDSQSDLDWVFLRRGHLRFPRHMDFNQHQLRIIGERRAMNCKHPNRFTKRVPRLADADIAWKEWQVFKRVDRECGYVSYVTYFRESVCGKHLIKVELDPDKFNYQGNLMVLPDYAEPLKEAVQ